MQFKKYIFETSSGKTGTMHVEQTTDLLSVIQEREFIKDAFSEKVIRSDSITYFELVNE